jgi:CDP-glucose 4,6-dehydratase
MDPLVARLAPLRDQRVLITGLSGFKGCWLAIYLRELGAQVWGMSLAPQTNPSLFQLTTGVAEWDNQPIDIRHREDVRHYIQSLKPTVIFHLAAQSLVLPSYDDPMETFDTNIGGSANVLDAIRSTSSVRAIVYVTSDKCYRNDESGRAYVESDSLGGHDPYSASKAAAEIVFEAFYKSFFSRIETLGAVSVRSGNVIGGGDWSADRIMPDSVRSLAAGDPIVVRRPQSVRPWQHVLDPLTGYLMLAADLVSDPSSRTGAWNFGPDSGSFRTVEDLTNLVVKVWGSGRVEQDSSVPEKHEAGLLVLDSSRARKELGWKPRHDFEDAVRETVLWYQKYESGGDPLGLCVAEIRNYLGGAHD